jgi:hypothetical protein
MAEIANILGAIAVIGLTATAVFPTFGSDVFPAKKAIVVQSQAAQSQTAKAPAVAGDRLVSEGGTLAIGGAKLPAITNEFTPKGRYTVGPKTYSSLIGGYYYPFKIEKIGLMSDRNPLKKTIRDLGMTDVAYAIHAGKKSNGCIVLSSADFAKAEAAGLEGRTIDVK